MSISSADGEFPFCGVTVSALPGVWGGVVFCWSSCCFSSTVVGATKDEDAAAAPPLPNVKPENPVVAGFVGSSAFDVGTGADGMEKAKPAETGFGASVVVVVAVGFGGGGSSTTAGDGCSAANDVGGGTKLKSGFVASAAAGFVPGKDDSGLNACRDDSGLNALGVARVDSAVAKNAPNAFGMEVFAMVAGSNAFPRETGSKSHWTSKLCVATFFVAGPSSSTMLFSVSSSSSRSPYPFFVAAGAAAPAAAAVKKSV